MKMKIKVVRDTSMRNVGYHYYCADDGGVLGLWYSSGLGTMGMTFSFHCGICDKHHFMTIEQLRRATLACEFFDGVGHIELGV